MTKTPKIEDISVDFSKYDLIFIGSHCWFGTYAPPLNTFFKQYKFKDKKVAIFTCNGGNLRHTHEDFKKALSGNEIVSIIDFVYPIKNGIKEAQNKTKNWALDIIKH